MQRGLRGEDTEEYLARNQFGQSAGGQGGGDELWVSADTLQQRVQT